MPTRPPRELRLALSMNGGVSLAVWIGGFMPDSMLRPVAFKNDPADSIDTNEVDDSDD